MPAYVLRLVNRSSRGGLRHQTDLPSDGAARDCAMRVQQALMTSRTDVDWRGTSIEVSDEAGRWVATVPFYGGA